MLIKNKGDDKTVGRIGCTKMQQMNGTQMRKKGQNLLNFEYIQFNQIMLQQGHFPDMFDISFVCDVLSVIIVHKIRT